MLQTQTTWVTLCPQCNEILEGIPLALGTIGNCPHCNTEFRVAEESYGVAKKPCLELTVSGAYNKMVLDSTRPAVKGNQ